MAIDIGRREFITLLGGVAAGTGTRHGLALKSSDKTSALG
jgi:hypothetical protein